MKRVLGAALLLSLILLFWMRWGEAERNQFNVASVQNSKVEITDAKNDTKVTDANDNVIKKEQENLGNKDAQYNSCNQLKATYPNLEHEFNVLMEDIYIGGGELGSGGPYSNMDELSLANLAKGGDRDALYFHGTNLIWQGTVGVRIFRNYHQEKSPSTEKLKKHSVNFEKIKAGEDFVYQAAVKGKFGGLLEIKTAKQLTANQLIRTAPSSDKIKGLLVDYLAYTQVIAKVHQRDNALNALFVEGAREYDLYTTQKRLKKWQPDLSEEERKTILQEMMKLAEAKVGPIIEQWIEDRRYYGEEPFPKLLTGDLEVFANHYLDLCQGNKAQ